MNTYRITFRDNAPVQAVRADSVNGFKPSSDSYVFRLDGAVVAVVPKNAVLSVTKVDTEGE